MPRGGRLGTTLAAMAIKNLWPSSTISYMALSLSRTNSLSV